MISSLFFNAGIMGLLIFFLFFVLMMAWVFRPGAKKSYQNYASIPFKESEND